MRKWGSRVPQPIGFDTSRTFVRVVEHRPDGFVEFHFSIGGPSLFVEMLLTEPAFAEFCALHRTELLDPIVHSDTENEPDATTWSTTGTGRCAMPRSAGSR